MLRHLCLVLLLIAASGADAAPVVTTVDSAGVVGLHTSITYNQGPIVSYYDATQGDLKMATCTAGCLGTSPTWVVTTVDSAGDVGRYSSIALNSSNNPVIAYYDATNAELKLATCTNACATSSPVWVIATVDRNADVGRHASLQMGTGSPVIAYRDATNGDVKLATCVSACTSMLAGWVITIVDGPGDMGRGTVMALNGARPVIAYLDASNGAVKLATCTADCSGLAPTWVRTVIDNVPGNVDAKLGLRLNFGNPSVSYYDAANGDLKVATCTAGCGGASPTWRIHTADTVGDAGQWSSLWMNGGTPIVAYFGAIGDAADLRLAICDSNCPSPRWVVSTLDGTGSAGGDPSLVLVGDTAIVSYHDARGGDLKVARVNVADAAVARPHTSLWWDADESGWGINFTHQGDIVFGTLFTYDASGQPLWLVMSAGRLQSPNVYSGELYRTTGPSLPPAIAQVGTMTAAFAGDSAALTYSFNGITVNKAVRKQVFGTAPATCFMTTASRAALTNYQDLWWNPAESGWGINLTHQGNIIFATLFTYEAGGRGAWYVMSAGMRQPDGSYVGDLYRTTGPAFNAAPFPPIGPGNITRVGNMQLRFGNGESGTLSYSVDGANFTKPIVRQVFSTPLSACG